MGQGASNAVGWRLLWSLRRKLCRVDLFPFVARNSHNPARSAVGGVASLVLVAYTLVMYVFVIRYPLVSPASIDQFFDQLAHDQAAPLPPIHLRLLLGRTPLPLHEANHLVEVAAEQCTDTRHGVWPEGGGEGALVCAPLAVEECDDLWNGKKLEHTRCILEGTVGGYFTHPGSTWRTVRVHIAAHNTTTNAQLLAMSAVAWLEAADRPFSVSLATHVPNVVAEYTTELELAREVRGSRVSPLSLGSSHDAVYIQAVHGPFLRPSPQDHTRKAMVEFTLSARTLTRTVHTTPAIVIISMLSLTLFTVRVCGSLVRAYNRVWGVTLAQEKVGKIAQQQHRRWQWQWQGQGQGQGQGVDSGTQRTRMPSH